MRTLFSVLFLSFLFETDNVTNNYNSSTISDHTHGINPRSSHAPASPPSATAQPLIILDLLHLIFFRRQLFFRGLDSRGAPTISVILQKSMSLTQREQTKKKPAV